MRSSGACSGSRCAALIERGQAAGEFSAALSPEWASRVLGALVLTGARAVIDGSVAREDAPDMVLRTLFAGIGA